MTNAAVLDTPYIPFVEASTYPVRAGALVRPLVDGDAAFRRICEAVEAAQHSVWLTVAFFTPDFEMPDGRGSLFDVLDRAVARGVEVRALFWRNNEGSGFSESEVFSGFPEQREMLAARGSRFLARWDRAQKAYCHHQKSWIVDAGQPGEVAFIGGINLNTEAMAERGHGGSRRPQAHDLYVEVQGPSASDVHHNFVQRWNEASERGEVDGRWGHEAGGDLLFPVQVSSARGGGVVQIQRTVRAGQYFDDQPAPHGHAFPIAQGEFVVFEQYRRAITAARRSIYIENQALGTPEIIEDLHAALQRGVEVVCLVPADANGFMRIARQSPQSKPFFDRLGALGERPNFTLVGIAAIGDDGVRRNVYVHAKAMLIDDVWASIGSCNIGGRSFFGDTELNASFHDPAVVRALRCDLLAEHLQRDTSDLDDVAALRLYGRIARANSVRATAGATDWRGIAFALDPVTYGA